MSKFKEIDLSNQKKYSLKNRPSKVTQETFSLKSEIDPLGFLNSLPDVLKAAEIKELLEHCSNAYFKSKPIITGIGGHFIKCGLSPLLIEMIRLGLVKSIAANGSVIIHDFELTYSGHTSEDVSTALEDGSFGMAKETGEILNEAIKKGSEKKLGLGESIGQYLDNSVYPYKDNSVVLQAYKHNVPFTVHSAIGTDIIHQHSNADGCSLGDCSLRDFRIFCNSLIDLNEGGVFLNFGSAVILPEVFLKAVTVVRNLGISLKNFYTAVFDMNYQYRPKMNIVERPVSLGGKGYYFIGHHEIMIPLFLLSLKSKIESTGPQK